MTVEKSRQSRTGARGPQMSRVRRRLAACVLILLAGLLVLGVAQAQVFSFPERPKPDIRQGPSDGQMLVQAGEIHYDYANQRVSAVGNVQIYYKGSTLEADRVIYDQKNKRLHAEGNARLTEPNGQVTHGEIITLSDDYRDGFVDSLRVELPDRSLSAGCKVRTSGFASLLGRRSQPWRSPLGSGNHPSIRGSLAHRFVRLSRGA